MKTKTTSLAGLAFTMMAGLPSCSPETPKPNVVIIFLDDSGWADFNAFTPNDFPTPHTDQLAAEGCCFDNFYVPQAVCSASRSALMTGCYPGRTKVFGAHPPNARGLDTSFMTMGQVLQNAGYATGFFGKWHLGDQPDTRPWNRGFDETAGLMYSNDMWKYHPDNPDYWGQFPLRFWENGYVINDDVTTHDQKYLTRMYTERAVSFIERHKDEPFFLYLPHSMPHVPIFCSDEFEGITGRGLYADVIAEIDWSVGQVMKTLDESGVKDNTLIIFTSDNGPWVSYGNHAGVTPFREAKGTSFDGGTRSACIVSYPGEIEPGTRSGRAFASIDLLPVVCRLTGAALPPYEIDGKDVWDYILGDKNTENPHDYYAFSTGRHFEAVLSGDGKWKLHLPYTYRVLETPGNDGASGRYRSEFIDSSLYDMEKDPFESENVITDYPEIARHLVKLAESHKESFFPDQE